MREVGDTREIQQEVQDYCSKVIKKHRENKQKGHNKRSEKARQHLLKLLSRKFEDDGIIFEISYQE